MLSVYKNSRDSSDFYGHVFVGLLLFRELILTTLHQRTHFTTDQFFKKILEDISPFCGAADVCDFRWHLPWVKAEVGSLACMLSYLHKMNSSDSPLVQHLLTSWQTAWQLSHSSTYLCTSIGGLESRILFRVILLIIRIERTASIEFFLFNYHCQWLHWFQQFLQKQWCIN